MTIEEKAKAYDEVLEQAKKELNTCGSLDCDAARQIFRFFPQLAESEDERIRKILIHIVKGACNKYGIKYVGDEITEEKLLAYLEKQKEQPKEELVYRLNGFMQEYIKEGKDEAEKEHRFKCYQLFWDALEDTSYFEQKEQKPTEDVIKSITKNKEAAIKFLKLAGIMDDNGELAEMYRSEQKSAELNDRLEEISRNGLENAHTIDFSKEYENSKQILEKSANYKEWSEDYREEDIQTRFAFYTYKDDPSVLYLSNVFVEETSRNHGFGTRILKAAEKVAEAIGAITICLKVKQDSSANAWYRKHGYGYVTFEDGYDWLEKNLEYLKPTKSAEWSEENENHLHSIYHYLRILKDNSDNDSVKKNIEEHINWLSKRYQILLESQSKQEWSEEDEEALHEVKLNFELNHDNMTPKLVGFYERFFNKLKSLRPQPKNEWSEEDEKMYNSALWHIKNSCSNRGKNSGEFNVYNWLKNRFKSLRPQPHWKPSEEQMEALYNTYYTCSVGGTYRDILESLYEQLKKLM